MSIDKRIFTKKCLDKNKLIQISSIFSSNGNVIFF